MVSGTKEGADPEEAGHPDIGPSMDLGIIASHSRSSSACAG